MALIIPFGASLLLLLICISSSALCRELIEHEALDSAPHDPSNLGSSEWQYDRPRFDGEPRELYGEQYTRHGRREPEDEERCSESEEKYHRRPHYQPEEKRRYIEEGRDCPYHHEEHYEKPRKAYDGKEQPEARHDRYRYEHEPDGFVLEERSFIQRTLVSTEAGEMSVILPRDAENEFARRMIALGILTLEPQALLLPHYTNTHCLFIVVKGKGRVSWVNGENLQELDLNEGDVYKIESGTLFYLMNTDGESMHIFSIHDMAPGSILTKRPQFHSLFVACGSNLGSVLSGFDDDVLATSFNVSGDVVDDLLSSQLGKPIIYVESKRQHPSMETKGESSRTTASKSEKQRRDLANILLETGLGHIFEYAREELDILENAAKDTPEKPLNILQNAKKDTPEKPLNILQKKPTFSNDYGATTVADESDFGMLKDVNKGVFSVKLKPGAILAPHWNPRAMEIAVVTEGEGKIQIVYPDGKKTFTGWLTKGSIFYVPQNFVACQIASTNGVLEFLGFSTSSRPNCPQFLAGSNTVLKKMNPGILASSFNIPVQYIQKFLDKQRQAVILPGYSEMHKDSLF